MLICLVSNLFFQESLIVCLVVWFDFPCEDIYDGVYVSSSLSPLQANILSSISLHNIYNFYKYIISEKHKFGVGEGKLVHVFIVPHLSLSSVIELDWLYQMNDRAEVRLSTWSEHTTALDTHLPTLSSGPHRHQSTIPCP